MHANLALKHISLVNFKSYREAEFDFSCGLNFILGNNGNGKTNLLDAIHVLALTKSAFVQDLQAVRFGTDYFALRGVFLDNELEKNCFISYQKGKSKNLRVNDAEYDKISDHIGKIPLILIKPDDAEIIAGGSEERRKFFDNLICQSDPIYLANLLLCNHLLKERNALLKNASANKIFPDNALLETYNSRLLPLFKTLFLTRKKVAGEFSETFIRIYAEISSEKELPDLIYRSQLEIPDFDTRFEKNFSRDYMLERTELGTHKDDYLFLINEQALKKAGSQGQIKTFLLALKLAAYFFIREKTSKKPILLLDDIADKLDPLRMSALAGIVMSSEFGQVFITDAHTKRVFDYFQEEGVSKVILE
jgi:DNA replication and repair protein RecF